MLTPARVFVAAAIAALASAGLSQSGRCGAADLPDAPALFFQNIRTLCGQQFEGKTEFPDDPNHPLAGKKLTISFERSGEGEIRVPLHAGEDKSRTWILTLHENRLQLKHDHRHPDGTPDKQTNYGGSASADGDARRQRFPADAATAELIPEAATNVWTLEIDGAGQRFTYALERNGAPRYKAVFNLKPVAASSTAK